MRPASSLRRYTLILQDAHQLLMLFDSKLMHIPRRLDGIKKHVKHTDVYKRQINVVWIILVCGAFGALEVLWRGKKKKEETP